MSIMASLLAWTSSAGLLSNLADFPLFGAFTEYMKRHLPGSDTVPAAASSPLDG